MLQELTDEEEEEMDSAVSTENKVGFDSGSTACVALVNKVHYAPLINPWLLLLVVFIGWIFVDQSKVASISMQ